MPSFFKIETHTSAPMSVHNQQISFQSRAVSLTFPKFGGLVWNRPTAVIVQTAEGAEQTLAVRDVTRLAQILVLALGIAGALFVSLVLRERK